MNTTVVVADAVVFAAPESDQQRVTRLIEQGGAALAALAALLSGGQITQAQFIERATLELRAHSIAAARLSAGAALDRDAIAGLLDDRATHLDGFAADIAGGTLSAAQIASRSALWAGVVHTAFQMGKAQAAVGAAGEHGTVSITWGCVDDTSSCADCPDLADGSPYTFETLPTYPGGDVACGGNCRCELDYEVTPAADAAFSVSAVLTACASLSVSGEPVVFAGSGR